MITWLVAKFSPRNPFEDDKKSRLRLTTQSETMLHNEKAV